MWKVACKVKGQEKPEVVECTNPDSEVNRFLFKDAKAHVTVTYGEEDVTRRVYNDGVLRVDVVGYREPLKSIDDYADALAFMAYVGTRKDYITQVSGTTKKQRNRLIERRLTAARKDAAKRKAA